MEHALKIFAMVVWFFMTVFAFHNIDGIRDFSAANPDMVKLPSHLELINSGSLTIIGFSFVAAFVVVFVWMIKEINN